MSEVRELTDRQVRHWFTTWLAEVLGNTDTRDWDYGLHDLMGPTPATVGRRLGLIDHWMAKACREARCRQFVEYRARRAKDTATAAEVAAPARVALESETQD